MRSSLKGVVPEWYTLQQEEGQAEPVQFYIQPLDGISSTQVTILGLAPRKTVAQGAKIGFEVIKTAFELGVKGWRNIEDADNPGQPLEFSPQAIRKLHRQWIIEVGGHVLETSEIGEERAKNSDSPSSSPAT